MANPAVVFLLDWRPVFWSTREEYFRQLSRRLTDRRVTPVLVTSAAAEPRAIERFQEAGAEVLVCSYNAGPVHYWAQIRQLAGRYSIRIAQVRFFDYFTPVHWICRAAGIGTVFFTEANGGAWTARGGKAALLRLRTRAMCAPLTRVIAISDFIRRRLIACGIPPERIEVVYNGVDIAAFHPDRDARAAVRAQVGVAEGEIVLLFAATLQAWKRPEIALEVCAELARRGCASQLWIAGAGPLRAELEARAQALGIAAQVRWLGHRPDPQAWMAGADFFLHTGVDEAFGNVFVEAMACGLPAIATRSGAAPELVEHGVHGLLVAPGQGEATALANAVEQTSDDRVRYQAMSRAAQARAASFTTEACVERTLALYDPFL